MWMPYEIPQFVKDIVRFLFVAVIAFLCMKIGPNSGQVYGTLSRTALVITMSCLLVFLCLSRNVVFFNEKQIPNERFRNLINTNIREMKIEMGSRIAACLFMASFIALKDFFLSLGKDGNILPSTPFLAWFAFTVAIFCAIYTLVNLQGLAEFNADVNRQIQRELNFRIELLEGREKTC